MNACAHRGKGGLWMWWVCALVCILPVLINGCTSVKQLTPAIEANQQNIHDLQANYASTIKMLRVLADAVLESELAQRRAVVAGRLVDLNLKFAMAGGDANIKITTALNGGNAELQKTYEDLKAGLAAFPQGDPSREQYLKSYPILSAYFAKAVTAEQINAHLQMVPKVKSLTESQRHAITDVYPYVAMIVTLRASTHEKLDLLEKQIDDQLRLAVAHADLFHYAATTNLNVESVFKQVVTDSALQSEVLGRIPNQEVSQAIGSLLGDLDLTSDALNQPPSP